jgi:hypothetical protein
VFEAKQVVARVDKMGDLFAPVLTLKQRLPELKGLAAPAAAVEAKPAISIAAQAEEESERVRRRPARKTGAQPKARKAGRKV